MEHEDLGTTKLDHILSYIVIGFTKMLELLFLLLTPIGVIEQVVIYATNHSEQMIPLFVVLIEILLGSLFFLYKKWRSK